MHNARSPFALANIRRFIAFRVFFNARFYYPVFTILFLDYGLSIEQFSLLNTVWAFTIVLAEIPSGALADLVGRKRLLVATSLLMVGEMALIAFVPVGDSLLVFWVFLANRVLSGLAEAMASGADEAMAYDTLVAHGDPGDWPRVLDIQMRMQHAGYLVAMTVGAAVYDPGTVNRVLAWLGSAARVDQQVSMRFPVYLTLLLALLACAATLGMRDPVSAAQPAGERGGTMPRVRDALRITLRAGRWILQTPFAMAVILFGMAFDHVLRMLVTLTSQYFRLIDLPEASFGLIGSAVALLGLVVPRIARAMVEKNAPGRNLLWVAVIAFSSVWGLTLFIPWFGLLPMMTVFVAMMFTSFFTSHYLNRIAASNQRATVLSFKGLAFNGAYGLIGILYALLIAHLRHRQEILHPAAGRALVENRAFMASVDWFPWYLLAVLVLVFLACRLRGAIRDCGREKTSAP